MFVFQLGREFRLTIAEILTVFPKGKTVYYDKRILILEFNDKNIITEILLKAKTLGGTIKIIHLEKKLSNINDFNQFILDKSLENKGKFTYGVNAFGKNLELKNILQKTKKTLKYNNISSRFINKNFENLASSHIFLEKLIEKNTDFNVINTGNNLFAGISIWIQNIEAYSKRDWQKSRDMQVGMLPPKLAQIMINLSGGNVIYDPFVGLGTVLIESVLMGNDKVYGSDLSEKMVETSTNNIKNIGKKLNEIKIFKQNAKYIDEIDILEQNNIDTIVTEGYLGEIMTQKNISLERIEKQKKSLLNIYEGFFQGLKKLNFNGNIVICFPFWELKGKYIYFLEIYNIINKYCNIQRFFPIGFELTSTKSGSLLYKRKNQLVGREIFKLTIKNNE